MGELVPMFQEFETEVGTMVARRVPASQVPDEIKFQAALVKQGSFCPIRSIMDRLDSAKQNSISKAYRSSDIAMTVSSYQIKTDAEVKQ